MSIARCEAGVKKGFTPHDSPFRGPEIKRSVMVSAADWRRGSSWQEGRLDARSLAMKNTDPVVARSRAERRRFQRVQVDLPGKLFLPAVSEEHACTVIDLSPGGANISCDTVLQPETQVVLYANTFGRFEGAVVRCSGENFGIRFVSTALKRERTAEQLTLYMNRSLLNEADLRRDERTPTRGLTRFVRHDGQIVPCEVMDLSMSGISVKTDVRPVIGEFVLIGQLAGRVARHHEQGIGIEFVGASNHTAERLRSQIAVVR